MRWRRNDSDAANHYQQNRRTYVSETSRCANRPHRRGDRAERRENLKTLPYWTRFPASHRAPPESSPCLWEAWPFPALLFSWLRLFFSFLPLFSFLLRGRSFLFRVILSSRPHARGGLRCRGRDRSKPCHRSVSFALPHRRLADRDCK